MTSWYVYIYIIYILYMYENVYIICGYIYIHLFSQCLGWIIWLSRDPLAEVAFRLKPQMKISERDGT